MKTLLTLALATIALTTTPLKAGEVIDLGKIQVEGESRGPQLQLVTPDRLEEGTARKMLDRQLKEIEAALLKSAPQTQEEKPKNQNEEAQNP